MWSSVAWLLKRRSPTKRPSFGERHGDERSVGRPEPPRAGTTMTTSIKFQKSDCPIHAWNWAATATAWVAWRTPFHSADRSDRVHRKREARTFPPNPLPPEIEASPPHRRISLH